jgi:hypothetical protein
MEPWRLPVPARLVEVNLAVACEPESLSLRLTGGAADRFPHHGRSASRMVLYLNESNGEGVAIP